MTDEKMVAAYGKQWRVEHAFSWLKSGNYSETSGDRHE
jgi:transposase